MRVDGTGGGNADEREFVRVIEMGVEEAVREVLLRPSRPRSGDLPFALSMLALPPPALAEAVLHSCETGEWGRDVELGADQLAALRAREPTTITDAVHRAVQALYSSPSAGPQPASAATATGKDAGTGTGLLPALPAPTSPAPVAPSSAALSASTGTAAIASTATTPLSLSSPVAVYAAWLPRKRYLVAGGLVFGAGVLAGWQAHAVFKPVVLVWKGIWWLLSWLFGSSGGSGSASALSTSASGKGWSSPNTPLAVARTFLLSSASGSKPPLFVLN